MIRAQLEESTCCFCSYYTTLFYISYLADFPFCAVWVWSLWNSLFLTCWNYLYKSALNDGTSHHACCLWWDVLTAELKHGATPMKNSSACPDESLLRCDVQSCDQVPADVTGRRLSRAEYRGFSLLRLNVCVKTLWIKLICCRVCV